LLCEKEYWVGYYANKYPHMGNRTSNRAEGTHSAMKAALGKVSSGNLWTVTSKIDKWFRRRVRFLFAIRKLRD
jgi:hypothetical protein